MQTNGVRGIGRVAAGILLAASLAGRVEALPRSVDADQDGWLDGIETALGSDPADVAKSPESVAAPPTCFDGLDNDGDGKSDIDDPGCNVAVAAEGTFPAAGVDVFDSHMTLDDYPLATVFGLCQVDFDAHGPTVMQRSNPVDLGGGLRRLDVEMIAMQLTGTATVNASAGCTLPAGELIVTVIESPSQRTVGQVNETNHDPAMFDPLDICILFL